MFTANVPLSWKEENQFLLPFNIPLNEEVVELMGVVINYPMV